MPYAKRVDDVTCRLCTASQNTYLEQCVAILTVHAHLWRCILLYATSSWNSRANAPVLLVFLGVSRIEKPSLSFARP